MRMLQEWEVDCFFGRRRVRHVERNQAIFIKAPHPFCLDNSQIAVDRVPVREQVEATPKLLQRYCFQPISGGQEEG